MADGLGFMESTVDRNLTNDKGIAPILGVAEGQRLAEVHSAAADEYRTALRRESGMSRGDRIQVRLALSDSLISLSDYEQALDVLEEILEFDWLDETERGRTLARASRVLLFLGNLRATLISALAATGGVDKSGSLRSVVLKRKGEPDFIFDL